jgi:hypothetical protein
VLTGLLTALAPLIRQDWVILLIVLALAMWAIGSGISLRRATSKIRTHLVRATQRLKISSDPVAFATEYESVSAEFSADRLIGGSWTGFSQSLIVPSSLGRPVTATVDARQWFDLSGLFRSVGSDPRYHAALPGLLVGAGLLFTFLGLAAALTSAREVVAEGVDQARRNAALGDLLGAASVKFITSLAGLGFSITYALYRKHELVRTERIFGTFLGLLEERLPFRSSAFLQAEANLLQEKQYAELQRISNDFFVNLGSTLERSFDNGLQQHIGPLSEAIAKLSGGLTNQNETAMNSMLETFLARLEGTVGDSMKGTADTLEKLGTRLDGLQSGLDEAALKMGRAAEEMAAGMGRGTQSAMAGISEQMNLLVSSLRQAAEEAGRSNRAAGDDLARQMSDTASSLMSAVSLFQSRLEQGAADGVNRLAAPIEALLLQLSTMAEAQRQAGAESTTALAATIARAAGALEATATQVADTLGGGAADASGRLVAATEAMRDDLRGVLDRFGASLSESGAALTSGAKAGGDALLGAALAFGSDLGASADRLRDAGEAAGAALREGGNDARAGMTEATRGLLQATGGLGDRLAALGGAAGGLADQANSLARAAEFAAVPLGASAADLRAASEAARETTSPLREVAELVRGALEGLRQAADAMENSQRGSDLLAKGMVVATDRFEGLDENLALTLRRLNEGLSDFRQQITDFVSDIDKGFSRSVESLSAIASSLDDTAEQLVDAGVKRSA